MKAELKQRELALKKAYLLKISLKTVLLSIGEKMCEFLTLLLALRRYVKLLDRPFKIYKAGTLTASDLELASMGIKWIVVKHHPT